MSGPSTSCPSTRRHRRWRLRARSSAIFKPLLTKDPLSWHIERFVRRVKERMAIELVRGYHDMLEDPDEIDEIELRALEMARELTEVVPSPKARRFSEGKARKEEYERRKKKNIQLGINIGIPTYRSNHARRAAARATDLRWPAWRRQDNSVAVLHRSTPTSLARRCCSSHWRWRLSRSCASSTRCCSQIRYHALKALELNPEEEEKWHEILERAEEERMEQGHHHR